MGKIIVYSNNIENHSNNSNNFYIGRPSPLCNPFTYEGKKSKFDVVVCKTREEAINAYKEYFKQNYGKDNDLTREFDRIFELYKNGEDIYLECFCKPLPCHGDFIKKMLEIKLLKENDKNNK